VGDFSGTKKSKTLTAGAAYGGLGAVGRAMTSTKAFEGRLGESATSVTYAASGFVGDFTPAADWLNCDFAFFSMYSAPWYFCASVIQLWRWNGRSVSLFRSWIVCRMSSYRMRFVVVAVEMRHTVKAAERRVPAPISMSVELLLGENVTATLKSPLAHGRTAGH